MNDANNRLDNPHDLPEAERRRRNINTRVPLSLASAVKALEADKELTNRLGASVVEKFKITKLSEIDHAKKIKGENLGEKGDRELWKWEIERY